MFYGYVLKVFFRIVVEMVEEGEFYLEIMSIKSLYIVEVVGDYFFYYLGSRSRKERGRCLKGGMGRREED